MGINKEPLCTIAGKYLHSYYPAGKEFRHGVQYPRDRAERIVESLNKTHKDRIHHWLEADGVNPEKSGMKRALSEEPEGHKAKRRKVDYSV